MYKKKLAQASGEAGDFSRYSLERTVLLGSPGPCMGHAENTGTGSFSDSPISVHQAQNDSEQALTPARGWWPNSWVDLQIIVTRMHLLDLGSLQSWGQGEFVEVTAKN